MSDTERRRKRRRDERPGDDRRDRDRDYDDRYRVKNPTHKTSRPHTRHRPTRAHKPSAYPSSINHTPQDLTPNSRPPGRSHIHSGAMGDVMTAIEIGIAIPAGTGTHNTDTRATQLSVPLRSFCVWIIRTDGPRLLYKLFILSAAHLCLVHALSIVQIDGVVYNFVGLSCL